MQRGLMAILGILIVAFLAITFLKQETGPSAQETNREVHSDRRSEVVDFWNIYQHATDLRTSGEYEAAIPYYEKAIELNGDHKNSLYYLGNMYLEQGAFERAEETWTRLLALNKQSARAYVQLGRLYGCSDSGNTLYDLARSEQQYLNALRLNREETGPMLKLAELNILRQRYEAADSLLHDVVASNFRSAEAFYLRGYLAWLRTDREQAQEDLSRAVAIVKGTAAKNVGEGETESDETLATASRCGDAAGYRPLLETAAERDWSAEQSYRMVTDSLF